MQNVSRFMLAFILFIVLIVYYFIKTYNEEEKPSVFNIETKKELIKYT